MKPEKVTYPPLDVLKRVADNIWIVDSGPLRALGMPLPIRMTVIKLRDGGLLLHSPHPVCLFVEGADGCARAGQPYLST